jgi:signal transduction histidine kinase
MAVPVMHMSLQMPSQLPVAPVAVRGGSPAVPGSEEVNVLIVDDEPRNLTVLESVLDDPGYRLVRAASGEEALLALMAQEFAVLVLDVRMPGMSGFELAQMVKERRRTAHVPIIFLTAYYNEDQHMAQGYGSGAVDYLPKPINPTVLRSKVAVFAALHRQGRALAAANRRLEQEVMQREAAQERLGRLNATLDRRVSERTQALRESEARLREADRRKDEFLATLAHELRNPLAPVRNAVHLMRLEGVPRERLAWAGELIERQVGLMSRLIDDLMDVSRINQGKIGLKPQPLDLRVLVADAEEAVQPLIREMRHVLSVQPVPQDIRIRADRVRLSQVLLNLLNNAAKYMDPGGRIQLQAAAEAGWVVLRVRDEGVGIPPDRLEAIFELFSQVESALDRSRGGLGIGLSLARRIVELHGGTLTASSAGPGLGSEFVVRLPALAGGTAD